MQRSTWACLAFLCVACQIRPPSERPPAPPAASSSVDLGSIVDSALRDHQKPVAAVVLGFGDQRVLALGRHNGADPGKTAVRPGSTIKPLLAWVAARAGVLGFGQRFACAGNYAPIEGLHCFDRHGELGLIDAIAVSCNAYFFELGRLLGFERVRAGFDAFGLGRPTRLAPDEVTGLLPTLAWADEHRDQKLPRDQVLELWAASIGAGHGPLEVTPLQLAAAYLALAKGLTEPRGQVESEIFEGLRRVVQGENGTGKQAAVEGLDVVGKTGTAESTPFGVEADESKQNGWFVGFAPASKPEILVAILTVEAGSGGDAAAPVAGRIFREWHASKR